jgi:putative ATP-binding cassette transporter
MDSQANPLKTTAARFAQAVTRFANSEVGWKAKLIFGVLVVLLWGANALNVVNSYVGRNFMTAIADRDMSGFVRQAFLYIGVFAASTLVAVIARFGEERLSTQTTGRPGWLSPWNRIGAIRPSRIRCDDNSAL